MLAPAAFLLAVVVSSRHWVDSGDMSALAASGQGGRVLVPPTVIMGVVLAGLVALCTQVVAPAGRTMAREILIDAAHNMYLRPGPTTQVGDVWVRVGAHNVEGFEDVTVIGEDWIAWAPKQFNLTMANFG